MHPLPPSARLHALTLRGVVPESMRGQDHLAWAHLWEEGRPAQLVLATAEQIDAGRERTCARYTTAADGSCVAEFWQEATAAQVGSYVASHAARIAAILRERAQDQDHTLAAAVLALPR